MIERVVKSALGKVEKALDAEDYIESNPLNFQLYYADRDGRAEMINTVYLEDGNPKLDLYLEVFNQSSGPIAFASHNTSSAGRLSTVQQGGTSSASAEKCHFSIRWEKDLKIKPIEIELEQAGQWQVNYDEDSHFFTLYFLSKQPFVLESKNLENDLDRILLKFKNFTANNRDVKTSNVELLYGSPLLLNSEGEGFTDLISYKNAISVTNHPDDKNIPLQFRFIGPNTILNDGTTANSLKLQIINRPSSNNTRPNLLLDKANSKFIVDFEIGSGAEALIPTDKADNIEITTSNPDWNVTATQNETAVKVDLKTNSTKDKLVSGETIELEITGIVTGNPSGVSFLYITYQNIGNYPDGRLVVPIEKTPLLYRGTQVGIGTTSPLDKLHVDGNIRLSGNINGTDQKLSIYSNTTAGNSNAWIELWGKTNNNDSNRTGELSLTGKYIEFRYNSTDSTDGSVGMRLTSEGKVGIGTTSPTHQLHIKGQNSTLRLEGQGAHGAGARLNFGDREEVYITEDEDRKLLIHADTRITLDSNVGIGTNTPSAKLHVDGGDAIFSGKIGIGTTTPSAKLHVSGGDAIVSGKVGIGITTPSVNAAPKIHLAIGDDDTGLQQQGDGILAIYTDNVERVRIGKNGNVGIGTTDPKEKLHVVGDLVLGTNDANKKFIIHSRAGTGDFLQITSDKSNGDWAWETGIILKRNGNVGIGTNNPQHRLHVQGRIRVSDVPVWDGGGGCDVTWVGASGWGSNDDNWNCLAREGSSERYKQNIAPLEDDFQKLLSLQPKQYQMREGYGEPNTWQFGYLAEDLDKIGLKSLVIYNESGQPDGIQYKKMCIYLNEVVKSQQSSMERLEQKVNELNEKLMSSR